MKILLIVSICFSLSLPADASEPFSFWTILEYWHQNLQQETFQLERGCLSIDRKIESLKHMEEDDSLYRQKKAMLKTAGILAEKSDALIQSLLEKADFESPNLQKAPDHVLEKTRNLQIGSNAGGIRSSQGFARACPADNYEFSEDESGVLLFPVNGILSAGTWSYPSGSLHLGADLAAPMYSDVIAPADGLIVYADAPVPDGGGYLGNWCGWPYGGGNTMAMIARSDGKLYAISFCHLSRRLFAAAGQQVRQGDLIAKSGNSGNSTGPHTHVEVLELKVSFEEAVSYFQRTADFAFQTGWDTPAACSPLACRRRPEQLMHAQE